jgi:serine/threonine protein kinase
MEHFPAGSLKFRMIRRQFDFLKSHAPSIFKQAATGLAYMNASGWVHRDIKPDNLMVNSSGELRIIDFALSVPVRKRHWWHRFRKTGKAKGTLSYMSPEQIRNESLDGRSDIYSFAASAYEIVTGRPPFRGSTAQELLGKHIAEKPTSPQYYNADVTDQFAALVLRMLAKDRNNRPRDFHEVLMALRGMRVFKSQIEKQPATP